LCSETSHAAWLSQPDRETDRIVDEWLHPEGNRQPQGWVIPESLRNRSSEPVQGQPDEQPPDDQLPDYSQPASYASSTHAPAYANAPAPTYAGPPSAMPAPAHNQNQPAGSPAYGPPPAFGQPGQGGYLPGGPGLPPWLAANPVRQRSRTKMVAAVAGSLVLSLLILAVVLGALQRAGTISTGAGGNHRLTLPEHTDGYVRITTPVAVDLGDTLTEQLKSGGGQLWSKPIVGIYGRAATGTPSLVFIGGDGSSNPNFRSQLGAASPKVAIDSFMAGAHVAQVSDLPAGKFGGLLRCGPGPGDEIACAWVDGSTLGTLVLLHVTSLPEAGATALAFRNATEH
jgi:hypothetical protein